MSFIGPASLFLFKPVIWAYVLSLRAHYFHAYYHNLNIIVNEKSIIH